MAKKKKRPDKTDKTGKAKKTLKPRKAAKPGKARPAVADAGHAIERLFATVESERGGDPATSAVARLFGRGRDQIAKKLGEEAVEAMIEGLRGDKAKLVGESADLLYHLLCLWSVTGVEPAAVWAELGRRAAALRSRRLETAA